MSALRQRIGMFGGTFNPPHVAHLIGAELAVEQLQLDTLLFVPANIPPHKTDHDIAEAEHRVAMTRLAIAGNPRFAVSEVEIDRSGKSFTIDTIGQLKRQYKPEEFYLLIGLDMLAILESWKDSAAILNEAILSVMLRPGNTLTAIPDELRKQVQVVEMPQLDISSTIIRQRIARNLPIDYFVPEAVGAYIEAHHLYRD
jgi:nicotinate-nucleotide adenylyltransferase